jgi:putative Holliday junction resolvase
VRILALDWGTVRIGAAVSDPTGKIAFPLEKFIDAKVAIAEIRKLVAEQEVEKIIIGVPKNLSGNESASSKASNDFFQQLKKEIAVEYDFVDERLSSLGATKTLKDSGVKEKDTRQMVDNLAAAQMLQAYLDTKIN